MSKFLEKNNECHASRVILMFNQKRTAAIATVRKMYQYCLIKSLSK